MILYLEIILISLLISLSGCKSINDAPIKYVYVVDTDHDVCSQRLVTDKTNLGSKWVQDLPLSYCDGVIGLTHNDFLNLRTYMKGN